MAVAGPAGMWRDTESRALQINAETALRAIRRAVAIARLTIAHHFLAFNEPGKRKVMTFRFIIKSNV